MPTHTTITENLDGTFNVQVHDADALRRIQTMCDIIREDDDDPTDDDRALTAAYAGDLYAVIGEALSADYKANGWQPGADRWDALTAWLCRNPASRPLPWEYMGHDEKGAAHYRERQHGNRLTLTPSGRLARIHTTTTCDDAEEEKPASEPRGFMEWPFTMEVVARKGGKSCPHCNGTEEIYHSRASGNRPCPYCAALAH